MRLLFCIDHFGSGGAQRQIVTLARALHSRGHTIEFFIYHPQYRHFAEEIEALGLAVHSVEKRGRLSLGAPLALRRLVRHSVFDGVLAFLQTPSLYAEIATIGHRAPPLVVSERFMFTSLGPLESILQQAHRLATHITVNSHHQRLRMEQAFPWMLPKISTIYNGIDTSRFAPTQTLVRSGPLRLLVVSSTAPKKNGLGLVRALDEFRRASHDVPVISWAGRTDKGPQDQANKREIDLLLLEHDLTQHWNWLGERQDIPELLREHHALIHPAFFEGLPNSICEALSSGIPVVASRVCDHPRLVAEGVTGFLFDPHDSGDIAKALLRLNELSDETRAKMGAAARSFALEHLSVDRYATAYESLFSRLRAEA